MVKTFFKVIPLFWTALYLVRITDFKGGGDFHWWPKKEVTKAPFAVPMLFNSDFEDSKFVLKLAPVSLRKTIIWSRNCPFVVVLRSNEDGEPHFYLWFLLVMATQKIYIKEIKIWAVEVVFFKLDMNDAKLGI